MKKEKVLKYLILICSMVMSFFIFTSGEVNALEYSVNDDKIILNIVPIDDQDITKGYSITESRTSCATDDYNCVVDWVMPSVYLDGNPIVEIADGDSISGVLSNVSKVISGKITVGNNIEKIGMCAFCDFDYVEEIILGDKVSRIGEYAFAHNDSLKTIEIKAFNDGVRSELINVNAFALSPMLSKIVFKNSNILSRYRNQVSGWEDVETTYSNINFTYKVSYRFYDEEGNLPDENIILGYVGETLEKVPNQISRPGFNFEWKSKKYSNEITVGKEIVDSGVQDSITLEPIHEVIPTWSLKSANIYIRTGFEGDSVDHKGSNKLIEIDYMGKNKILSIEAIVEHELIEISDTKLRVDYSWDLFIDGISDYGASTKSLITAARVGESGTYVCNVNLNYEEYEDVEHSVTIVVKINPKDLIININEIENEFGNFIEAVDNASSSYYSVDNSTKLVDGELIVFNFEGDYENRSVGTYEKVLTGEIVSIGYEGDSNNYISDYNIEYVKGNLIVNPKSIEIELIENIEIEYGEEEVLTSTTSLEIYDVMLQLIIQYTRKDPDNKTVGSYEVDKANVVSGNVIDNNYSIDLSDNSVGKIVITPRKVNVEWNIEQNLVYSGIEKEVSASYKDIYNSVIDLNVAITKNSMSSVLVNAGTYALKADMMVSNPNYELVGAERALEIEKADSVFVGNQRQVTTYNGKPQRVNVSLNHSEGTVVYGDYNKCKNAHYSTNEVCTISVSVDATENYKAISGNFYLHINPYELVVQPDLFEFSYGIVIGQYNLNRTYDGVNGEKVVVYFAKEGGSTNNTGKLDVGKYNISSAYLANNTNYKAVMVNGSGFEKIKINPAPVEIRFMNYGGLVYDGNIKNIGVRCYDLEGNEFKKIEDGGLEDLGLVVNYGNKVFKNAGDYQINVSLTNDNFYIHGNDYLEFSIAKANYNTSHLKLRDEKVKFNFKSHFINLEGDLPKGLFAIYTIDGEHGNGTYMPLKHTVKVVFEGDFENYNYVAPLVATLNIDMSWVWWTLSLFLFVFVAIPVAFCLLVKYKVIKIRLRVRRSVVKKLIKKSRELDALNQLFKEKREALHKPEEDVEEGSLIEDSVTFVKNVVKVPPEEQIELSFVDELFKSSYGTKQFYSEVKNELLSYDGIVSKIKRDYETFYLNNIPVAKLDVVKGVLYAYFALDPTQYKSEEYHHEKVLKNKDFTAVPLKLKVDSIDSLRHAKMFVRIIRKREGIKFVSNFIRVDYVSVYTSKEGALKLFKKAFVKKGTKEYEED